jgi:adenylate cyclase
VAPDDVDPTAPERLGFVQRSALRRLRKAADKADGEPLAAEDWAALWSLDHSLTNRAVHRLWKVLPADPRCQMCGAPFAGVGRLATRPMGFRPSRKNPHMCSMCIELSPPGGAKMLTGVLFADLRGFTRSVQYADPEDVSRILRRFYGCAEKTLFPEAIIDKLIGDEVMALYLHPVLPKADIPRLMVKHARALLRAVGYGTTAGPFVDVGIGIDYGEAFVGNIGQRDVYDFTAIGDVVNTASRLQGQASGGQIVVAERAAGTLADADAERIEVDLKGKDHPVAAHRITVAP